MNAQVLNAVSNRLAQYDIVQSALETHVEKERLRVQFSAFTFMHLSDTICDGPVRFVYEGYFSAVYDSPTALDCVLAANDMLLCTDDHHKFFEGLQYERYENKEVTVYRFVMGS